VVGDSDDDDRDGDLVMTMSFAELSAKMATASEEEREVVVHQYFDKLDKQHKDFLMLGAVPKPLWGTVRRMAERGTLRAVVVYTRRSRR
jgi:hypothetical protein